MISWIKKYARIFKKTFARFFQGEPMSHSASIAFYTIFSMPAILIISLVIAGSFYEDAQVKSLMMNQIQEMFGKESASQVLKIMENANQQTDDTIAKIIGIGTLVFSATTVFVSLQDSLNHIWRIKPKPKHGIIGFLVNRALSLAMVVSIGFLLLVSLIIDALLVVFNDFLRDVLFGHTFYIISGLNLIVSLGVITVIFAIIYKVLPDARVKWRDVWVGAFVATLLFNLGKYLMSIYMATSTLATAYGAAGSLVLLLVWVYYSAIILLFGAEFTFVYSQEIGEVIKPSKRAVRLEIKEIEKTNDSQNN
ncbi:MAG: YihY/virulence factor BrkB family protein [Fulvivirga sp.]|nr:YihY/virulence factor BrkB family protein [Fulvivirga sp.]